MNHFALTSRETGHQTPAQKRQIPRACRGIDDMELGERTPDLLGAIQALSQLSYSTDGAHVALGDDYRARLTLFFALIVIVPI